MRVSDVDAAFPMLPLHPVVEQEESDLAPAAAVSASSPRRAVPRRRNGRWVGGGSPPTPESGPTYVDELVTEFDRPSLRRPPVARIR